MLELNQLLNQRNEVKKLKEQEDVFQTAYSQLNVIIDDKIRQEVEAYKNSSVFGRWWYRAFTDSDMLTKVTAVAYQDAISKIKEMQNQMSDKITETKVKIFTDPSDETSLIPGYTISALSSLAGNTIKAKDETLLPLIKGKKYLENLLQEIVELNKVTFFADRTYVDNLETHKNEIVTLLDKVSSGVGSLFSGWIERVRRVTGVRMLNPNNHQHTSAEQLNKILQEDSIELTQEKTAEAISSEYNKLTKDQQDEFEQKYPHYVDRINTYEVITDPVIWSGDNQTYERNSIKKWLGSNPKDNLTVIRSPLTGIDVSLTEVKNTKLSSNKKLQTEILESLKNFVNELQSKESVSFGM